MNVQQLQLQEPTPYAGLSPQQQDILRVLGKYREASCWELAQWSHVLDYRKRISELNNDHHYDIRRREGDRVNGKRMSFYRLVRP